MKNQLAMVVLAIALAISGCQKSNQANGSKTLKLAFVTNNPSDYWTIARAGVNVGKTEVPDVDVSFLMPSDGTATTQRNMIQDLLVKGVDGIAVSPVDAKNQTPDLNKFATQTLLFTQDSDAPDSDRVCYIGTDNVAAGRMAGDLIKKALPNGGKIMLFVGKLDAQNGRDRKQGIVEALKGTNITIVDTRADDTDHSKAKSNAADAMIADPDLACLVGLWSYNGPAILSAVKEAGKIGKVKIVCFDEETDTLDGVKNGEIVGTVVQQPYEFGRLAVVNMAKYLRGDKSVVPADKRLIVPTRVLLKDDVDAFRTQLAEERKHS